MLVISLYAYINFLYRVSLEAFDVFKKTSLLFRIFNSNLNYSRFFRKSFKSYSTGNKVSIVSLFKKKISRASTYMVDFINQQIVSDNGCVQMYIHRC